MVEGDLPAAGGLMLGSLTTKRVNHKIAERRRRDRLRGAIRDLADLIPPDRYSTRPSEVEGVSHTERRGRDTSQCIPQKSTIIRAATEYICDPQNELTDVKRNLTEEQAARTLLESRLQMAQTEPQGTETTLG
jgi:hypothetical protein